MRPGADPKQFETLFADKAVPIWKSIVPADWRMTLLIGDRGERKGKYLLVYEFPSVDERNRLAPDQGSGVYAEAFAKHESLWEEMRKLAGEVGVDDLFTDYVAIA